MDMYILSVKRLAASYTHLIRGFPLNGKVALSEPIREDRPPPRMRTAVWEFMSFNSLSSACFE